MTDKDSKFDDKIFHKTALFLANNETSMDLLRGNHTDPSQNMTEEEILNEFLKEAEDLLNMIVNQTFQGN